MRLPSKVAATLISLFLAVAVLGNDEIKAPTGDLLQRLARVETLHAKFEQTGEDALQTGEFWLSRPDRFRVESHPPLSQTIVSDGVNLWTYDQDLEQVIISRLSDSADTIPILLFASDPTRIQDEYNVDYFADESLDYFVLKPRAETSQIAGFGIAFNGDLPVRLSFQNAMQERIVIHFVETTTEIEDESPFRFSTPPGVDVIDDRPVDASGS